jgi:hypothetical protein
MGCRSNAEDKVHRPGQGDVSRAARKTVSDQKNSQHPPKEAHSHPHAWGHFPRHPHHREQPQQRPRLQLDIRFHPSYLEEIEKVHAYLVSFPQTGHLPVLPIDDPPCREKNIFPNLHRNQLVSCPLGADSYPVKPVVVPSKTEE